MEEGRVNCGNATVHYAKSGTGPINVLFLHDAPGSYTTDFKRHLTGFAQDKFTLVGWDTPGFGKSRPPDAEFPAKYHSENARVAFQLMQKLDLLPFAIVGHGDGAQTAVHIAHQQRNTQNVTKMVLVASSAYVSQKQFEAFGSPVADTTLWADHKRKPYVDLYGEDYFQSLWSRYLTAKRALYQDPEIKGNVCKHLLSEIPQSTLLIHPEYDFYYGEDEMDEMDELLPNSGLLIAEEMHHNLHVQNYEWFKKVVERFLLDEGKNQFDLVREEEERLEKEYGRVSNQKA
uniref:Serine aminopeptidase S33 domain-containing protein n=1 Tax=Plectus sambesii TaxID=2011161 RepID=A0A914W7A3_9BILA